jgi:hypothetical protein
MDHWALARIGGLYESPEAAAADLARWGDFEGNCVKGRSDLESHP